MNFPFEEWDVDLLLLVSPFWCRFPRDVDRLDFLEELDLDDFELDLLLPLCFGDRCLELRFDDFEDLLLLEFELRDLDDFLAGLAVCLGCRYGHSNILQSLPYLQSRGCQYLQSVLSHPPFRNALHGAASRVPLGAVPVLLILDPPGDLDVLSFE